MAIEQKQLRHEWAATSAPTVNDDTGDGFSVGSYWYDTTNDKAYVCLDATAAAAVWTEVTQSGGGGSSTFSAAWVTPSQITADQNNYNPGAGNAFRISSDAARTITGLSVNSNTDGDSIVLTNVGSFAITLSNQDAASTAANRMITGLGASIVLDPDDSVWLKYDGTTDRWRVIA